MRHGLRVSDDAVSRFLEVKETSNWDVQHVGELLTEVVNKQGFRDVIVQLRGNQAEKAVTTMQRWLSRHTAQDDLHRHVMRLLYDLAKASGVLPRDIFIHGIDDRCSRDAPIAGGSLSDVYRCEYGGQPVALKRLRAFGEDRKKINDLLCREVILWRQLSHPNVLTFLGIDTETFSSYNCMVSPWMEGGTLKEYVNSSSYDVPRDRDRLLYETAQGILYLHNLKIVHGDIKWINILIELVSDQATAKIADFGLAILTEATTNGSTTMYSAEGSAAWMSPERLIAELEDCTLRPAPPVDVYSFGILCHTMWTRTDPFNGINRPAISKRVRNGQRPERPSAVLCDGENLSDSLWDFIDRCWAQEPTDRPNMVEVVNFFGPKTLTVDVNHDRPLFPSVPFLPTSHTLAANLRRGGSMVSMDPLTQAIVVPKNETPKQRKARLRQEAKRANDEIDEQIRQERELSKVKSVVKVLLISQSESGKSTVIENLQRLSLSAAWQDEHKTIGVTEHTFTIRSGMMSATLANMELKIYDVGADRSQRQAWVPYCDDATAVIFLAPISAFDQVLAEDPSVNRLEDTFLLWKQLVSNRLLGRVHIILFLSGRDLLQHKLESGVRFAQYVPSYEDRSNDFESVMNYIKNKFRTMYKLWTPNKKRELYMYMTTAVMDNRQILALIHAVENIIYHNAMVSVDIK